MFHHTKGEFLIKGHGPENKKAKKTLVKRRRTHGIIVYSGTRTASWISEQWRRPRIWREKRTERGDRLLCEVMEESWLASHLARNFVSAGTSIPGTPIKEGYSQPEPHEYLKIKILNVKEAYHLL